MGRAAKLEEKRRLIGECNASFTMRKVTRDDDNF
jgi:hypothetical protein